MSIFTIGDLHLSLSANKAMDIFGGWEDYVSEIESNWQRFVKPQDTVVIAGDVSWAMRMHETLADFEFINKLNGNKIILKGNHDYWWTTVTKMENFFSQNGLNTLRLLHNNCIVAENIVLCGSRGWVNDNSEPLDKKVIDREAARLRMSIAAGLSANLPIICFLHYPPVYRDCECKEIMDVLIEYGITKCYYGHIHGFACNGAVQGNYKGVELTMVSADYLRFNPLKVCH